MSTDDKKSYIEKFLKDRNYDKAKDLAMVYFQDSSSTENEVFTNINICEKNGFTTFSEAEIFNNYTQRRTEEKETQNSSNKPPVEIVFKYLKYESSGYCNAIITVKNNSSKAVNYVKINMFFKDYTGKVIQSDWTNDDSPILSGATQKIEKLCKLSDSVSDMQCEIAEYN